MKAFLFPAHSPMEFELRKGEKFLRLLIIPEIVLKQKALRALHFEILLNDKFFVANTPYLCLGATVKVSEEFFVILF